MRVICLLILAGRERQQSLAEACIAFSPQVAVGTDSVFVEVGASHQLFTEAECVRRLQEVLELLSVKASIAVANDLPSALAFARFGVNQQDALPVDALADYLQPFAPEPMPFVQALHKLGVLTLGDFKKIPRGEIPSRFGKAGLFAYERLLEASRIAWPRFSPAEKIAERVDFDFAAQIETFEPVLFLLKSAFQRIFLRLYSRRQKLAGFKITFHLNRFAEARERVTEILLPLPQSEPKSVLALTAERLTKELELTPLAHALEGISVEVLDTAPFHDTQRDFFSKVEEERQAWAALVGRLQERLGASAAFMAMPLPRLLPEASWGKTMDENAAGTLVEVPLRPLRLLDPPLRLQRVGDWLLSRGSRWRFVAFTGMERLKGEWWLGGFEREYFRVETESGETLWVYTAEAEGARALWLHGIYD